MKQLRYLVTVTTDDGEEVQGEGTKDDGKFYVRVPLNMLPPLLLERAGEAHRQAHEGQYLVSAYPDYIDIVVEEGKVTRAMPFE